MKLGESRRCSHPSQYRLQRIYRELNFSQAQTFISLKYKLAPGTLLMLFETLVPFWIFWLLHVLKIDKFHPFKKMTSDPGPV
jgi:hypothetical protein